MFKKMLCLLVLTSISLCSWALAPLTPLRQVKNSSGEATGSALIENVRILKQNHAAAQNFVLQVRLNSSDASTTKKLWTVSKNINSFFGRDSLATASNVQIKTAEARHQRFNSERYIKYKESVIELNEALLKQAKVYSANVSALEKARDTWYKNLSSGLDSELIYSNEREYKAWVTTTQKSVEKYNSMLQVLQEKESQHSQWLDIKQSMPV